MDTLMSRPQTVRLTSIARRHLNTSTSASPCRGSGATCRLESKAVRTLSCRQALWRSPPELSRAARSMSKGTAPRKAHFRSNIECCLVPKEDTAPMKGTILDSPPQERSEAKTGAMFLVVWREIVWRNGTNHLPRKFEGEWFSSLDAARTRYSELWRLNFGEDRSYYSSMEALCLYDKQGRVLDEDYYYDEFDEDCAAAFAAWREAHLEGAHATDDLLRDGSRMYAVVAHISDHAEGRLFGSLAEAEAEYSSRYREGRWATRLYAPEGTIVKEYGSMGPKCWDQLDEWREREMRLGPSADTETAQKAKQIFELFDSNKDGRLSLAESVHLAKATATPEQQAISDSDWEAACRDMFEKYDQYVDERGLSLEGLIKMYESEGESFNDDFAKLGLTLGPSADTETAQKAKQIFELFDSNKDGRLSLAEIVHLAKATATPEQQAISDSDWEAAYRGMFEKYDQYVDEGGLSLEGLIKTYESEGGSLDEDFAMLGLTLGAVDAEAVEVAEEAPAGASTAGAAGSGSPMGVAMQIVNVKDKEVLYACRHSAAPARSEDGAQALQGFQRMVSTEHIHELEGFPHVDEWVLEPLCDGHVAIRNVNDDEYLVSCDHEAQSSLNRDGYINFNQRMVSTSKEEKMEPSAAGLVRIGPSSLVGSVVRKVSGFVRGVITKNGGASERRENVQRRQSMANSEVQSQQVPDGARWALKPAPGGDGFKDRYYIVNVKTGEALYSCRHQALSQETSYGTLDNTMDRRMVSTGKCDTPSGYQEGPLENADVWYFQY